MSVKQHCFPVIEPTGTLRADVTGIAAQVTWDYGSTGTLKEAETGITAQVTWTMSDSNLNNCPPIERS